MNDGWDQHTIQDFIDKGQAELKTGPFGTQLKASDYVEEGTPVINVRNIGYGTIREKKLEFIEDETVERLSSHLLEENDIVFGRKGAVERHVLIQNKHHNWFQGSDCLRLRIDSPKVLPRFISYYFLTERHKRWMINQCSHGATMASLNQDIVSRIPIEIPPIETQKEIVGILSAFDEVIENNSRRIEILEEMARRIYREWFVHFRYPGHENDELVDSGTELGEVPEGWEVKEVDDIVDRLSKGNIYRKKNTDDEGDIIIIDQSTDEYLGFHDNEPDFPASPGEPYIIFGDHTCKMQLLIRPFSLGPNVVPFIAEDKGLSNYYLYYLLEPIIESREYKRHWTTFKVKKVAVAPTEIANKFEKKVRPLIEQKENLKKQINKLKETRDLLLPKLISGKIDVEELNINDSKIPESVL
jgi:type I restriction enzyme S subunit